MRTESQTTSGRSSAQVAISGYSELKDMLGPGKLRAIAVTGSKRLEGMADVPTVAESLPGYEAVSWGGVMVPAGTPKEIVTRLNTEINRILNMPDVAEKLRALGAIIVGSTPEEFDKYVKDEITKWGKVARDNNIAID